MLLENQSSGSGGRLTQSAAASQCSATWLALVSSSLKTEVKILESLEVLKPSTTL